MYGGQQQQQYGMQDFSGGQMQGMGQHGMDNMSNMNMQYGGGGGGGGMMGGGDQMSFNQQKYNQQGQGQYDQRGGQGQGQQMQQMQMEYNQQQFQPQGQQMGMMGQGQMPMQMAVQMPVNTVPLNNQLQLQQQQQQLAQVMALQQQAALMHQQQQQQQQMGMSPMQGQHQGGGGFNRGMGMGGGGNMGMGMGGGGGGGGGGRMSQGPRDVEELLQSQNQQWIKLSEKRGLYRLVVQDKVNVREAAVKTVQNPDTLRMLTQTPWRRVQAALEKFVQAPKNPERDGKVAWAKLSKETKEALKAALETKKFKEAIESEITDAAVVTTFTSLGREWMKRQIKESLGSEVVLLAQGQQAVKRTREELEEATAVVTALEGEALAKVQKKLESAPFSKVVSAHTGPHNEDVPEALRAALRTLGSADTKGVFSEKLKVELNLFVQPTKEKKVDETKEKGEAGDTKPSKAVAEAGTGGKKAAAAMMSSKEAFETLTDQQKTALKGHLQANGFKAAVEKLKEAKEGEPEGSGVSVDVIDAMVREGRDVMRKLLKAAFDEDVKFWTREDEAKAKCKALPLETLKSLAEILHTLPHTEAVNATCADLDATDRQALKTVTKHVLKQLLEEVLGMELTFPEDDAARALCLEQAMSELGDHGKSTLARLLCTFSLSKALETEEYKNLGMAAVVAHKLQAAAMARVKPALEQHLGVPLMTPSLRLRLAFLALSPPVRQKWKTAFMTTPYEAACKAVEVASEADRGYLMEMGKGGIKGMLGEYFGLTPFVLYEEMKQPKANANTGFSNFGPGGPGHGNHGGFSGGAGFNNHANKRPRNF